MAFCDSTWLISGPQKLHGSKVNQNQKMDFIKSNLWNTWKNMLVIKPSILLRKIVFLFLYLFYFRFPAHFWFRKHMAIHINVYWLSKLLCIIYTAGQGRGIFFVCGACIMICVPGNIKYCCRLIRGNCLVLSKYAEIGIVTNSCTAGGAPYGIYGIGHLVVLTGGLSGTRNIRGEMSQNRWMWLNIIIYLFFIYSCHFDWDKDIHLTDLMCFIQT